MTSNRKTNGWNLDQGLAAQYAAQAGLDPDLAAGAGEKAWNVLRSLRATLDETNSHRRGKLSTKTRRLLAKADLGRHPDLKKAIQARLYEITKKPQPSINPETGLQEFFWRRNKSFKDRLTNKLEDKLQESLPGAELDDRVLNPKVEYTPEYYSASLLYNQGTPEQQAQRPLDAATEFYGDPNSFNELDALTTAVNKKWTPTGITASDIARSPAEIRDLYKSQGVDPQIYNRAPIAQSGNLDLLAQAKPKGALLDDPYLGRRMAASHQDISPRVFIDHDANIREKTEGVKLDDPMYGVYETLNNWNERSKLERERSKVLESGSGDLLRMYPWGKRQVF